MTTFQEANTVAALAGARGQSWYWPREGPSLAAITAPNGPPPGDGPIVDGTQRIRGSALVACRLDPRWREALIEIAVYETGAMYDLELDYDEASSGSAHATVLEALEALRDSINGLSGQPYEAAIVGEAGDEALRVRGSTPDDWAIRWTATGSGELSITADAVSASAVVWAQPDGDGDAPDGSRRWAQLAEVPSVGRRGRVIETRTPGRRLLYIEATEIRGHDADGPDVAARVVAGLGVGRR